MALLSYWNGNKKAKIGIKMDDGSITWMPIKIYFRKPKDFPKIEQIALKMCRGNTLDVGAGAGAHSLELQRLGKNVMALDSCAEGIEIIKQLGIKRFALADFLEFEVQEKFDTLLFLMNGAGLAGNLDGLRKYLRKSHELTNADGQLIVDSSDLRNGEVELDFDSEYFGEINYQLIFEETEGAVYQWLYVDQEKLAEIAAECHWNCNIIFEQEDGSYLAQLTKMEAQKTSEVTNISGSNS
jgi:SAM-dependent methyltransferase